MEAKHTPGPWERHGSEIMHRDNDRTIVSIASVTDSLIVPALHEAHKSEFAANAALIAAAPDMYEALRAARQELDAWRTGGPVEAPSVEDDTTRTQRLIDAALAKAEGK